MAYSLSQFRSVLKGLGYIVPAQSGGWRCDDGDLLDSDAEAIEAFQADHHLPISGKFDRPTGEKARQLVQNLQHSLNLTLNAQLPINEFYGSRTAEAVCQFQQQHGLSPTGIAGAIVRQKLDNAAKQQLRDRVTLPNPESLRQTP